MKIPAVPGQTSEAEQRPPRGVVAAIFPGVELEVVIAPIIYVFCECRIAV
jgi:hypothetical protein